MSLEKKKVVVLGSTGSIGRQTLDVIDKQKERFELLGIAARDEVELLAEQALPASSQCNSSRRCACL